MWHFAVHMDRKYTQNWPETIIKDSKEQTCTNLDGTVPADKNISQKEFDKFSKYKDLKVTKMWKHKQIQCQW